MHHTRHVFEYMCIKLEVSRRQMTLGFKLCGAVNLLKVLECHENFTALFIVHMHMKGSFFFRKFLNVSDGRNAAVLSFALNPL